MTCFCGSIIIPIGKKYDQNGSYIKINSNIELNLIHNAICNLKNGETFISNTSKCPVETSQINSISISWDYISHGYISNGPIQVIISDFYTDQILYNKIIRSNSSLNKSLNLPLDNFLTYNLYNKRLKVTIISVCEQLLGECLCCKSPKIANIVGLPNYTIDYNNKTTITNLNINCCYTT